IIAEIYYAEPILSAENKSLDELVLDTQELANPDRDRATYTVYDNLGREIFKVDPNGNATRKDYDENNNVLSVCQFKQPIQKMENYDNLVTQLKSKKPDRTQDTITDSTYDTLGFVSTTVDALGNTDSYGRNAFGHATEHTDR